jgi:hypothetical protein
VSVIPSILVTIFVLHHLLISRALRKAVNNHIIILLRFSGLILELTDLAWYIHYLCTGTAFSSTLAFCLAWVFIGSAEFVPGSILIA